MKSLKAESPRRIPLLDAWRAMEENPEVRDIRPLYWFVMLFLAVIYFWTLSADRSLLSPVRFVLFTALMALHALLHWTSPVLTTHRRWILPYFLAQGALVVAITSAAGNQGIVLGLYMGLIGEATGILGRSRSAAVAVVSCVALLILNAGYLWGWESIPGLLLPVVPMMAFVLVYVYMFLQQIQARKRAQQLLRELEAAHRQLADYAERVEDLTLAAERQRMARELHDTLAQGLAGLILQLEALEAQLGRGDVRKATAIAGQAKDRARGTLVEARRTIDDLRSLADPMDSLEDTVRREVERFSSATGIPCDLVFPKGLSVSGRVAESIHRCVAEGLANVARHARASHVSVLVGVGDGELVALVRDDGIGFDLASADGQAGHYGLLGLRERARLAGGSLDVESGPGSGTTLRMRLPGSIET